MKKLNFDLMKFHLLTLSHKTNIKTDGFYRKQVGATRALHVSNPFFLSVFAQVVIFSAVISFFLSLSLSLSLSLFLRLKIFAL
jgi:hypothetical protein